MFCYGSQWSNLFSMVVTDESPIRFFAGTRALAPHPNCWVWSVFRYRASAVLVQARTIKGEFTPNAFTCFRLRRAVHELPRNLGHGFTHVAAERRRCSYASSPVLRSSVPRPMFSLLVSGSVGRSAGLGARALAPGGESKHVARNVHSGTRWTGQEYARRVCGTGYG